MLERRDTKRVEIITPVALCVEDFEVNAQMINHSDDGALFRINSEDQQKVSTDDLGKEATFVLKIKNSPEKNFEAPILNILFREIEVVGTSLYRDSDFELAAELVVKGKVDIASMVSKVFPLSQAAAAFDYKLNQPSIKVLLSNESKG
ncbi:unnamed protein product [marine sediment metagenome]|uniref:Alcohol dehydrogenase-like C-terminal domain-containing protein n=1 Tax=marine sediment metagenome TaxID=412755 RepID=X1TZ85_9ZZZZ